MGKGDQRPGKGCRNPLDASNTRPLWWNVGDLGPKMVIFLTELMMMDKDQSRFVNHGGTCYSRQAE